MVWLPLSATYRLVPLLSTTRPLGCLNVAAVPVPSALPAVPAVPASVVTTPEAMTIRRMVWLFLSATYRLVPLLSTARTWGRLNSAAAPVPSALPAVPAVPARVLTTPAGVILRMVWFLIPAVYRLPALSRTTPNWGGNPAAAAGPSTELAVAAPPTPPPVPGDLGAPAMVLATPAGVILRT